MDHMPLPSPDQEREMQEVVPLNGDKQGKVIVSGIELVILLM
jgi:hypothetical protein